MSVRAVHVGGVGASLYGYQHKSGGGNTQVYRVVANVFTQLGADYASGTSGDTLKISISGTTITPNRNSVDLATRTDSTLASGKGGIYINDDLGSDSYHDNWGGGDVAAGGSILPLVAFGTLGGNCNPMMG